MTYYCEECQNSVNFNHDCVIDKISRQDMGNAFNTWLGEQPTSKESYMNPQGYVDPTSKYYIDRMWEEYHKVKSDLAAVRIDASSAWQEYHKMKEELADTKCKLGQLDNYINETLKPELADAKIKLKMAQSAWDELDKSHAARAKLHDELIIAEGQRDQAKMRAEAAESELRAFLAKRSQVISVGAILTEVDTLRAERDALLSVYEAAEDFIGAQGTAYEDDQYRMLCGVVGTYNLENTNGK
jgi:hypothetical protein